MNAFALEIVRTSGEHVVLVATAVFAAFVIGAPAAIVLTQHARSRRWVLGLVNVIQTIPSLALFGVLLPIPLIGGIGKRTAILVLALYALLPIMRNMVVGILGVEAAVRESALAMGMTRQQILWRVEIPLALPTILAGLRIAIVSTIGTAIGRGRHRRRRSGNFHIPRDRDGGLDDRARRRRSCCCHGNHRRRGS